MKKGMGAKVKKRVRGSYGGLKSFKPEKPSVLKTGPVTLTIVEIEAIRLADVLGLKYKEASLEMGVSTATFGRIVRKARKTIADALVNSKAIRIRKSCDSIGRKPSKKMKKRTAAEECESDNAAERNSEIVRRTTEGDK